MRVVFFCTQEGCEVAAVEAAPGTTVTANLVRARLVMASGLEDLEEEVTASAKDGAPLVCPRCKGGLSVTYPGEVIADLIKSPRRLPLGCFRVPS